MVRYLADLGANLNCIFPISSDSALTLAVRGGDLEMVKLLLEKGADIDMPDGKGITPLVVAIEYERVEIIELLLHEGATFDENSHKQPAEYGRGKESSQSMLDLFSKLTLTK